jgi:receptor protein-tyrosine kinase/non-specific protein-tyrosine kinase
MGLILGVGIAFVVETMDSTIKTTDEAQELYGAPVLCSIPVEKRAKGDVPSLTLVENPGGPAAEAYRMLRNNLGFINFEHDIKVLLISSAMPNEGKSTVAANLAIVLARAGKRVVLLSCDFHQPGAAMLFDLGNTIGLSDVLNGTASVKGVLEQPKGFENLWVVPPGSMPPNPSELLGSTTMERLITGLRESSDWIILDSAPLLAVADAAAAARWVDGALMVVHSSDSTRDAARQGRDQLERVGTRILGVAMWGREEPSARRGYDGYFAGYGATPTV